MKIVQINSFSNGSTGKIMMSIHKELQKRNYESYAVWGRGRESKDNHEIYLNDKIGVYFHALMSRLTGKTGFYSKKITKELLKKIDEIKPDIIHLHNIHGYYINIEELFNYIKKNNIKIIWTLHDCWSFTGQCAYFTCINCNKWKVGCSKCPKLNEYPKTYKDNSAWNYKRKKELFLKGLDITLVTPSRWLANLVKDSFLKDYQAEVINNGIDLNVFKTSKSNFRTKYNIEHKKIILGVAGVWDARKGLDDFVKLSKILNDEYVIVLIGLSKKQISSLPNNIIGIERTENQKELVGIYSAADILFNPTYEDNYPTVNLEALACGTPVLSYDTGGSTEFVDFIDENKDLYIIDKKKVKDDIGILKKQIERIISNKMIINDISKIDEKNMINKYIELYERKNK